MVSEKIKQLRKEKCLSQKALAKRMGLSQVAICKIENGKRPPRLDRLIELANALEVDVAIFLPNNVSC